MDIRHDCCHFRCRPAQVKALWLPRYMSIPHLAFQHPVCCLIWVQACACLCLSAPCSCDSRFDRQSTSFTRRGNYPGESAGAHNVSELSCLEGPTGSGDLHELRRPVLQTSTCFCSAPCQAHLLHPKFSHFLGRPSRPSTSPGPLDSPRMPGPEPSQSARLSSCQHGA